jgi:NAD(P)-dependent dehydrogenase (short-subunit alcohol dehydrogenase family)
MRGKTVVITGATSGIGEVAALALAKMGARIIAVGRSKARGDATLARLRSSAPGAAHALHLADLSRLSEMKRVAAQIADQEARIDVLINNAGAAFGTRQVTEDGLGRNFALNHMAYFVLTAGLRERLAAAPTARIINTASSAHTAAVLDFDDLQSEKGYGAIKAYGRSKLCNILFTRELARRLRGTAVTRIACTPASLPRALPMRAAARSPISPGLPNCSQFHPRVAPTRSSISPLRRTSRKRPGNTSIAAVRPRPRRRRRMTARLPPCGSGARPWPASRTDGGQARAPLAAAQSIEIEAFVDWIICAASCAVSCAASRSVIDPSRTVIARIAGRPPIKRSPTPARENAAIWKAQVL